VSSKTAAIIAEPVQGEGGVRPLTPAFATAINEACAATGALLIADEVQSGLGRTGSLFYFSELGLKPHLVSLGKALGGGVPIGQPSSATRSRRRSHMAITGAPTAEIFSPAGLRSAS
jgi:acetylornithine/succinyldiaminopimelate/putrescine aminotransferase